MSFTPRRRLREGDDPTVAYQCWDKRDLDFGGVLYQPGDVLPYDAGDRYGADSMALLQFYWNQGWIAPA